MKTGTKILIAAGLGLAFAVGGTAYAMQTSEQLRATGQVGEQADGYLGIVGSAPADVRARVDAINIERRFSYSKLAQQRGTTIETAAASTACEILRSRVQPGQFYRLPDGVWRKRNGSEPVPLPQVCGG
jgi:uncharacterized protein